MRLASLMTLDCTTKLRMICAHCTSIPPHRAIWRVHRTCDEQLHAYPAACRSEQIAIATRQLADSDSRGCPNLEPRGDRFR